MNLRILLEGDVDAQARRFTCGCQTRRCFLNCRPGQPTLEDVKRALDSLTDFGVDLEQTGSLESTARYLDAVTNTFKVENRDELQNYRHPHHQSRHDSHRQTQSRSLSQPRLRLPSLSPSPPPSPVPSPSPSPNFSAPRHDRVLPNTAVHRPHQPRIGADGGADRDDGIEVIDLMSDSSQSDSEEELYLDLTQEKAVVIPSSSNSKRKRSAISTPLLAPSPARKAKKKTPSTNRRLDFPVGIPRLQRRQGAVKHRERKRDNIGVRDGNHNRDGDGDEDEDGYESMKCKELRELLRERAEAISGNKSQLIARLRLPRRPQLLIDRVHNNMWVPHDQTCCFALLCVLDMEQNRHDTANNARRNIESESLTFCKDDMMRLAEDSGILEAGTSMFYSGSSMMRYDGWSQVNSKLIQCVPTLLKKLPKARGFQLTSSRVLARHSGRAVARELHRYAHARMFCTCSYPPHD